MSFLRKLGFSLWPPLFNKSANPCFQKTFSVSAKKLYTSSSILFYIFFPKIHPRNYNPPSVLLCKVKTCLNVEYFITLCKYTDQILPDYNVIAQCALNSTYCRELLGGPSMQLGYIWPLKDSFVSWSGSL